MIKKILATGTSGLIGSRFYDMFQGKYEIATIGRSDCDVEIDLTEQKSVEKAFTQTPADLIINFAGYTDVQGAQEEDENLEGEVYSINTLFPYWLAQASKKSKKHLIHISTGYVFEGKKESGPYTEEDKTSPLDSWYSKTKYMAEVKIQKEMDSDYTIIRTMFPYSGLFKKKKDIARTIIDRLSQKEEYAGITDQKIQPTLVDEIARSIDFLIDKESQGIYHVAGKFQKGFTTPYNFALLIADIFSLDKTLIKPITLKEFAQNMAPIPEYSCLSTEKIEKLGMQFMSEKEALSLFKKQLGA